jgi:hypothetical protein
VRVWEEEVCGDKGRDWGLGLDVGAESHHELERGNSSARCVISGSMARNTVWRGPAKGEEGGQMRCGWGCGGRTDAQTFGAQKRAQCRL